MAFMSGLVFHLPFTFEVHPHCEVCWTEFAINYENLMALRLCKQRREQVDPNTNVETHEKNELRNKKQLNMMSQL